MSPTGVALGVGGLTGVGLGVEKWVADVELQVKSEGALNRVGPAVDSFGK